MVSKEIQSTDRGLVKPRSRRQFMGSSVRACSSAAVAALITQFATVRSLTAQSVATQEPKSGTDFEALAQQYSLDAGVQYLNHASIGTIAKPVQAARQKYLEICESNPWLHIWGDAWTEPLQRVRSAAAELIGCDTTEIAITHNTTEMFNVLSNGLPLKPKDEVLFSSLCHAGASIPFLHRAEPGNYKARRFEFPLSQLPDITADQIVDTYLSEIGPNTRVLVLSHIDNTVGIRYPLRKLADGAREKGVEFIVVDAAQTIGMIPVNCSEMNVDVVATSGHKWIGGPKGTGLAYVNQRTRELLEPMWVTWGQARWKGSARKFEDYGTRDLPDVLTLGDAIAFGKQLDEADRDARLKSLWSYTQTLVNATKSLEWTSPTKWDLSGSLYSVRVERPATRLAAELFERHGIVVRPFTNLGLNNLRVSPNVFTSKSQIEGFIQKVS